MQTFPEVALTFAEDAEWAMRRQEVATAMDAEDALLAWCYGPSVSVDIYLELSEAISTAVKTVMAKHEAQEKAAANYVSPAMSDHCATAAWYGRGEVAENATLPADYIERLKKVSSVKPALAGLSSIAADSRYQGMGFNGEA